MPFSGLHVSLFLYALIVLALLVAELREHRRAQFFFKPLAAFGFVILALQFGALESTYGKYILAGLVACALGDVLLLSRKSQKLFIGGMGAFALGHIIYSFGFMAYGLYPNETTSDGTPVFGIVLLLMLVFVLGGATVLKQTETSMKAPVTIYIVIICVMVFLGSLTSNKWVMRGAMIFAISDYFVGMDRLAKLESSYPLKISKRYIPLVITPLYFGAQALFALSTAI